MATSASGLHEPDAADYGYTSKMMLAAVVCLFTVIFLLIFLHLYAKWLVRRRRRRERDILALWHTLGPPDVVHGAFAGTNMAKAGLDSAVLDLIPVFSYKSDDHQEGLECAVCLSPFEDEEKGRELPPCRHCFHVQCIDSWLHLHSNCPVCRAIVDVADEVKIGLESQIGSGNVGEEEARTAETEAGAGSRSGEAGEVRAEVGESGEVSGLAGPSEVRVDIETGSRPEEGSSVVQAGTGCSFGSLKRMLSKNRVEKKVLSSNRASCVEEVEKV
ncbi:RING-H2 finger protein ATL2-like [Nymphaea colorata]|uniref:RING-type E3 ubiquitin transferase n=1 Tax=Nymphaea colorata TaxID=210225 RepID=A0A5K0X6U8_9MAGN|nr:RING-H2 finger protein ATL2-like [Nymphaea colorata]